MSKLRVPVRIKRHHVAEPQSRNRVAGRCRRDRQESHDYDRCLHYRRSNPWEIKLQYGIYRDGHYGWHRVYLQRRLRVTKRCACCGGRTQNCAAAPLARAQNISNASEALCKKSATCMPAALELYENHINVRANGGRKTKTNHDENSLEATSPPPHPPPLTGQAPAPSTPPYSVSRAAAPCRRCLHPP